MKIRHMTRHHIITLMKARRIRGFDVAAKAQTSPSTVTRVLSRHDGISDEVRERVWVALEEMLT